MGKLISYLIIGICILLGVYGLFVAGYFLWAANQPMQVVEAQAVAPGITFNEFMQDRYARWEAADPGGSKRNKACQGVSIAIRPFATLSANISVTIGHFKPEREAFFREAWNGIYPPTKILSGPLHKAWWWEVEYYSWFSYVTSAERGCEVGYPTRPVDAR